MHGAEEYFIVISNINYDKNALKRISEESSELIIVKSRLYNYSY